MNTTTTINGSTIRSFKDLVAWQKGHELVLMIYEHTKDFPKEEVFSLTNQLRRAAVSITSNIAEGFSRTSSKEELQFYSIAMGSLSEAQSQLIIAKDIGYLSKKHFDLIEDCATAVSKILTGLMKHTKTKF